MKKIFSLLILVFILSSCWSTEIVENKDEEVNNKLCNSPFILWNIDKTKLNLKWVVINDDLKVVSSPMWGVVKTINCDAWKIVNKNTLIAQIKPDFNNSNTINLSIQRWSLINQKTNLEWIKASTISSFDAQIANLKEQISITEKNIELTKKSSWLSKNDLEKQIKTLEDTLKSLKENISLSKKSKADALEKINITKTSLFTNIKSVSSDNLLKVDEIFWFTKENKSLNDSYENYISAKDSSLLSKVKATFYDLNDKLKNINNLTDQEISDFLWKLVVLDENARDAMKKSVVNIYFPQTQIDSLYTMFLNYWNNLSAIKSSWDSLENSRASTINTFDSQIVSLQNQIDTTNTSLENLKTNKVGSVDVWLDLQLLNLDSWLKTLKSNLENLLSTKDTQILSLDNQILQINQSIDSLNTNLSVKNVYAGLTWTIKQKLVSAWNSVWVNTPLCNILPKNSSTKIKIYSPIELKIWDKLVFHFNWKDINIEIKNALVYKDQITQNYIYESNYLENNNIKYWEILNLKLIDIDTNKENKNIEKKDLNTDIKIPVSYVVNKINWNFVNVYSSTWIVLIKVELWDINWSFVEINKWLNWVIQICK